jgi:hypothetical protein
MWLGCGALACIAHKSSEICAPKVRLLRLRSAVPLRSAIHWRISCIDFESAKSGFEKQSPNFSRGVQPNRALRENSRAEKSAAIAESVITTILMLAVGLSILAAILWGL